MISRCKKISNLSEGRGERGEGRRDLYMYVKQGRGMRERWE